MPRKRIKQHSCANCGFHFTTESEHTNFCPQCGQENHNPRFPLVHYGYELLEGFLHFDTKFLFSFKTLLFKPGQMTLDYINNIRGRYMPPLRLFIFISIFALLITGLFEKNLAHSGYFGTSSAGEKDDHLTISEQFDRAADTVQDEILVPPFSLVMNNPKVTNADLRKLKKNPTDSIGAWLIENGYTNNILTRFYARNKKLRISRQMTIPEVTMMVSGIFKWLFLIMIPINALLLFLLFYKKKLFFYDSMLYSIHFTSFFLIMYSILLLEVLWIPKYSITLTFILSLIILLILLIYLALSLKKVFTFSWFGTLARMSICGMMSFTIYQLVHYTISMNSGR